MTGVEPAAAIARLVDDFDPERGITIGTLLAHAFKNGWQPRALKPPFDELSGVTVNDCGVHSFQAQNKYTLLTRDDLMALPALRWRVKRLLPARGIAAIYGPSGSGKSFLAIDLAISICLGINWFRKKCNATSVVYLALEGAVGIKNRVKAWELERGRKLPHNFYVITQAFDLTQNTDVQAIIDIAPHESVVIIDTLNRATPGRDENSSSDMGLILAGAKLIEQGLEGLVLLVHHTGKDQNKGLRGHSSLHAALDAEIVVKVDKNKIRTWGVGKLKDEKDFESFGFRLEQRVIGTDEDGEPETSCTVEPEDLTKKPQVLMGPKGSQQKPAYAALKNLIENSPIRGKGGAMFFDNCVSLDQATAEIAGTLSTVERGKRTNRARAIIDALISKGFVVSGIDGQTQESWYWLPDAD